MTLAATAAFQASRRQPTAGFAQALGLGCGIAAVLMAPQGWSVWSRGTFLDPDDAMRAVEVRDFLAGQGWFDLVPHRLSPDHPFVMHWSRLVDAPLALGQWLLSPVVGPETAERVVRLVEPILLFVAALGVSLRLVRTLAGPRAMLPAACLLATSVEIVSNFLPGHIHHHGLQVLLLIAATAALLQSLGKDGTMRAAAIAGLLAVVSLGIGLQNLPFVVGLATAAIVAWVAGSRPACLAGFGLGLGGIVPVFLLDVPPALYREGACDAFSSAHATAGLAGGVVLLILAGLSRVLRRPRYRAAAASAGCAIVLAVVALRFPACLGDPMAGVDPVLRAQWLSGVGEALPLRRLVTLSPIDGSVLALTLGSGYAATLWAAARAGAADRLRWAALLLLVTVGVLGTLWQVRVAASVCVLMVPGVAVAVLAVFDRLARQPARPALLSALVFGLLANGAALTALASPLKDLLSKPGSTTAGALAACFEPASFAALAALPNGLVLSSIDPGSAILAATRHSVLAAPYHRNAYGNRVSLLSLAAAPDAAHEMIADAKARYVALCRFSNETVETATQHSDSLSAALLSDRVPAWLTRVGDDAGPYLLFSVAEPGR